MVLFSLLISHSRVTCFSRVALTLFSASQRRSTLTALTSFGVSRRRSTGSTSFSRASELPFQQLYSSWSRRDHGRRFQHCSLPETMFMSITPSLSEEVKILRHKTAEYLHCKL